MIMLKQNKDETLSHIWLVWSLVLLFIPWFSTCVTSQTSGYLECVLAPGLLAGVSSGLGALLLAAYFISNNHKQWYLHLVVQLIAMMALFGLSDYYPFTLSTIYGGTLATLYALASLKLGKKLSVSPIYFIFFLIILFSFVLNFRLGNLLDKAALLDAIYGAFMSSVSVFLVLKLWLIRRSFIICLAAFLLLMMLWFALSIFLAGWGFATGGL